MRVAGLDTSLTATDLAIDGEVSLIKSGPKGCDRMASIRDQLEGRLTDWSDLAEGLVPAVDLVAIEAPAFSKNQAYASEIRGLWWVVRLALHEAGLPVVDVPPWSLKKLATGKGNVGKVEVIVSARERLGFDNDSAIQTGAFLSGIGVIGLVWWFGTLWRAMRRASDSAPCLEVIALTGFVFSGAMAFSGFAVNAATASGIEEISGGTSFFFGLASVFFAFAGIGTAIMVMAISALAGRTGFLPKWLAQAGLVVVVANVLSGVGVASDAAFWGLLGFIAFLGWALWTVVVSLHLYQNVPADG